MFSTEDYDKDYEVGDLFIYALGHANQDIGYVKQVIGPSSRDGEKTYIVYWFKDANSGDSRAETTERNYTIQEWDEGYVLPVVR